MEESNVDVVADAGPLISLARIGEQELLSRLFDEILIPAAVFDEVTTGGPGAVELSRASWLRVVDPQSETLVERMGTGVNKGESWALALAEERGALLLVDDRQARRIARERGILHIGTAGILVKAGNDGAIPVDEVEPILRRLQADGMRISDSIIRQVLGRLGPSGTQ